jgi:hypothetical protein
VVLSYQRLKDHPRALRAFTGLDQAECEKLLRHFDMAYHAYMYAQHVTKKSRKRRDGAGRKPRLAPMEDTLLFILFSCKGYPRQAVIAFLLDTSQGRVHEWSHQLSIVWQMALGKAQALPERDPQNLEQTLALCVSVDCSIDGTERRVPRPQDATEQQETYSGKKKTIPCKTISFLILKSVWCAISVKHLRDVSMTNACVMKKTTRFRLAVCSLKRQAFKGVNLRMCGPSNRRKNQETQSSALQTKLRTRCFPVFVSSLNMSLPG